ncbi:acyl-CoA dehydrogenase C-terminal domain-containing protein [Dasania sp. GY-MA-18]|uniref:3-methylmercaptopropionyl-CoA dehydrogenase n=1 Tax=Dasania phycosphaerae TaxID=2950436 RepID=A0A9J6RKF9_9GAMM|nr:MULTISPECIES: acyl-CoA dehydrogenase C-terminal domain-containing protein [Dasania]MCR8922550.1 acyl-CoA dehydrogenase C-terminal domain-containing protein [Dasania sp. GY-MA-18]MCZ0864979.1 acyl-CoA dehydrogenase C-terminal domain-containing protein [Dasania phycosphaerae]MCZ0868706.1 acyl-CoA dehydrogenase C-terminal domain-containing protein [Dasania phycosphaerae]
MSHYQAPLRDIAFVQQELLQVEQYFQATDCWQEMNAELMDAVLNESAKFCEEVLAPLNAVGDSEGCQWYDGEVTTPTGFKEAYKQYVEGGWPALEGDEAFGGQAFPKSIAIAVTEMSGTANWAWSMYPGLSHGACHTISHHGSEEQKQQFMPKLVDGSWTGTMCLTESHCGSDLGMLRTKAEPNGDGSYAISGTKIFISSGEHDMAENIIHIVLARLPGAPKGTKGISLFIVPKFLVASDGKLGERNALSCGSLEHKMGIHGNATCVMNFDGATGYLIGEENRGLNAMFTFMNTARIGTAAQGLAHAEWAYQNSLAYARDRTQMRALSGPKAPDKEADPIIVHADVRRMLMTQKVFAEGARMLVYWVAQLSDQTVQPAGSDADKAEELLSLLTPIAKAFATETGFEAANLGLQIFGGHGYIKEWGMEQNVRDSRISMLYEGTTGIQSLDLLGRKILLKAGEPLKLLITEMSAFCKEQGDNPEMAQFIAPLENLLKAWGDNTMKIGMAAMQNQDEVNAACVDYLMYSGYITYAYLWAKAAAVAQQKLNDSDDDFYRNKVYSAQFYFQRILPRTASLEQTMMSGVNNLISEQVDPFAM